MGQNGKIFGPNVFIESQAHTQVHRFGCPLAGPVHRNKACVAAAAAKDYFRASRVRRAAAVGGATLRRDLSIEDAQSGQWRPVRSSERVRRATSRCLNRPTHGCAGPFPVPSELSIYPVSAAPPAAARSSNNRSPGAGAAGRRTKRLLSFAQNSSSRSVDRSVCACRDALGHNPSPDGGVRID